MLKSQGKSTFSRPMRKKRKNMPMDMNNSISAIGSTHESTAGPIIIPARTLPSRGGCLILTIISSNILALRMSMTKSLS